MAWERGEGLFGTRNVDAYVHLPLKHVNLHVLFGERGLCGVGVERSYSWSLDVKIVKFVRIIAKPEASIGLRDRPLLVLLLACHFVDESLLSSVPVPFATEVSIANSRMIPS